MVKATAIEKSGWNRGDCMNLVVTREDEKVTEYILTIQSYDIKVTLEWTENGYQHNSVDEQIKDLNEECGCPFGKMVERFIYQINSFLDEQRNYFGEEGGY